MATYTGNQIGVSKKRGILTKYNEEGSDMKLLKFGDFLKGSEPFITKDINTGDPVDRDAWVRKYKDNSEIAVKKRLEDTARISKFIASPRGVLWESHMAGLETIQKNYAQKQQSRINKARQGSSSDPNFGQKVLRTLANLGKSLLQDIGLTASTLSQVAASGTGYHADTYISRAYLKDGKKSEILNTILSYAGMTNGGGDKLAVRLGGAQTVAGSPDSDRLIVGDTNRYGSFTNRSEEINTNPVDPKPAADIAKVREPEEQHYVKNTSYTLGKRGVYVSYKVELNSDRSNFEEGEGDSKKVLTAYPGVDTPETYADTDGNVDPEKESTQDQFHPDGTEKPRPETVTVRVAKKRGKITDRLTAQTPGNERIWALTYGDKLPFYRVEDAVDSDNDLTFDEHKLQKELGLIPFCITTITPDHRTYLNFPAYLESYDDNYTGDWESVQYIGRAEKFYGYKGFTRSINLGFKVLARNERQVEPLYRNLNRLVGATAPSYGEGNVFMRGTLASLTIGGNQQGALLRDQLGFIPNVKLSWEVDIPWEIGLEGKEVWLDKGKGEKFVVPMVLNVSLQFTPIEKQEVREDYGAYFVFDPEVRKQVERPVPKREEKKEEPAPTPKQAAPFEPQQVVQGSDTTWDKAGTPLYKKVGNLPIDQVVAKNKPIETQEGRDAINAIRNGR